MNKLPRLLDTVSGTNSEKPLITIHDTDAKGMVHEQVLTTQNTRIK